MIVSLVPVRARSGVSMQWKRPGEFFPMLGWREPVALRESEFQPDRQLANLDPTAFNCHFYVCFQIRRQRGDAVLPIPRQDLLTTQCMRSYHFAPVQGALAPGDVLVAAQPDGARDCIFTHSALVLDVDASGRPTRIRQKFDWRHPVVDVDYEEFRMLYASRHPWQIQAWRACEASTL